MLVIEESLIHHVTGHASMQLINKGNYSDIQASKKDWCEIMNFRPDILTAVYRIIHIINKDWTNYLLKYLCSTT